METLVKSFDEMTLKELHDEFFKALNVEDFGKTADILEYVKENYSK